MAAWTSSGLRASSRSDGRDPDRFRSTWAWDRSRWRPGRDARSSCPRRRNRDKPRGQTEPMPEAIEVEGLAKQYGSLYAVDHIDFSVARGSVFAFLGPNGVGKTTTTEILEGLRKRTDGTVRVLGLDPWTDGYALHRRVGVIPQDFRFFEKITPKEGIEYYGSLFGVKPDPASL